MIRRVSIVILNGNVSLKRKTINPKSAFASIDCHVLVTLPRDIDYIDQRINHRNVQGPSLVINR